jgi:hypothetical protein
MAASHADRDTLMHARVPIDKLRFVSLVRKWGLGTARAAGSSRTSTRPSGRVADGLYTGYRAHPRRIATGSVRAVQAAGAQRMRRVSRQSSHPLSQARPAPRPFPTPQIRPTGSGDGTSPTRSVDTDSAQHYSSSSRSLRSVSRRTAPSCRRGGRCGRSQAGRWSHGCRTPRLRAPRCPRSPPPRTSSRGRSTSRGARGAGCRAA